MMTKINMKLLNNWKDLVYPCLSLLYSGEVTVTGEVTVSEDETQSDDSIVTVRYTEGEEGTAGPTMLELAHSITGFVGRCTVGEEGTAGPTMLELAHSITGFGGRCTVFFLQNRISSLLL